MWHQEHRQQPKSNRQRRSIPFLTLAALLSFRFGLSPGSLIRPLEHLKQVNRLFLKRFLKKFCSLRSALNTTLNTLARQSVDMLTNGKYILLTSGESLTISARRRPSVWYYFLSTGCGLKLQADTGLPQSKRSYMPGGCGETGTYTLRQSPAPLRTKELTGLAVLPHVVSIVRQLIPRRPDRSRKISMLPGQDIKTRFTLENSL